MEKFTDVYWLQYYGDIRSPSLKAGSQSDARPCIALIRETHKFIT